MIEAATPSFGAFAGSFESGIEKALVQCAESLTDFAVLFQIDEVAHAVPHLPFGFLNQEGFAHSHQGGASFTGDGFDVLAQESVVGGGGDDGLHVKGVLRVILHC